MGPAAGGASQEKQASARGRNKRLLLLACRRGPWPALPHLAGSGAALVGTYLSKYLPTYASPSAGEDRTPEQRCLGIEGNVGRREYAPRQTDWTCNRRKTPASTPDGRRRGATWAGRAVLASPWREGFKHEFLCPVQADRAPGGAHALGDMREREAEPCPFLIRAPTRHDAACGIMGAVEQAGGRGLREVQRLCRRQAMRQGLAVGGEVPAKSRVWCLVYRRDR